MNTINKDFFFHNRHRAQRGDLGPIILRVLNEKPMHGYEIIRTFEERSHGFWRPSPGSVYPILQYLEEQDLVTSQDQDGKKTYSITQAGKAHLEKTQRHGQHRPFPAHFRAGLRFRDMRELMKETVHSLRDIALHGSDEQVKATKDILKQVHSQLQEITGNIKYQSEDKQRKR